MDKIERILRIELHDVYEKLDELVEGYNEIMLILERGGIEHYKPKNNDK